MSSGAAETAASGGGTTRADVVRLHLQRVLASETFAAAPRLGQFLRFVVETALNGEAETIKETLIAVSVYGRSPTYDPQVDSTVRVEASRLRARLRQYYEKEGQGEAIVIELPKGSYAPVFRDRVMPAVMAEPEPVVVEAAPQATVVSAPPTPVGRRRWMLALAALLVAGVVGAGWALWRPANGPARPAVVSAVAVLPFVNLSADPQVEHFCDGLTEELTTNLGRLPGVRVPSRSMMVGYKNKPVDIAAVANAVHAQALVEGSVRREGRRHVITAQLIDARDGYHLWAETYARESGDALGLQREVAADVAAALAQRMAGRELWRAAGREPRPEVARNYFRAYELLSRPRTRQPWPERTPAHLLEAAALLEGVTRESPEFVKAWLGLAQVNELLYELDRRRPPERLAAALAAAERAAQLDPSSADAQNALASLHFYRTWDLARAERHCRRAIELNPRTVSAQRRYADLLRIQHRVAEAQTELTRAMTLEPTSPVLRVRQALLLYDQDRFDEAREEAVRAAALNTTREAPQYAMALWMQGLCDERQGRLAQAETHYRAALADDPHDRWNQPSLGHLLGRTGRVAEARTILASMRQDFERGNPLHNAIALVHTGLGEREQALRWLERGAAERDGSMLFLGLEKRFEPLRGEAAYQAIEKRLRALFAPGR